MRPTRKKENIFNPVKAIGDRHLRSARSATVTLSRACDSECQRQSIHPVAIGFHLADRRLRGVSHVFRLQGVISTQCGEQSISALETTATRDHGHAPTHDAVVTAFIPPSPTHRTRRRRRIDE